METAATKQPLEMSKAAISDAVIRNQIGAGPDVLISDVRSVRSVGATMLELLEDCYWGEAEALALACNKHWTNIKERKTFWMDVALYITNNSAAPVNDDDDAVSNGDKLLALITKIWADNQYEAKQNGLVF